MFKKFLGIGILLLCLSLPCAGLAQESKIGYVNMRKIFYEYKKTKDFNAKLEKEAEDAKKEVEKRSNEIKKLKDEIDILSEEAKVKREPELKKALEKLDDYRKEKEEGFLKAKDEMFQEIRKDIMGVSAEYAKKNNYDIIFDEAVFVYSSEKYNATDSILKELNKN